VAGLDAARQNLYLNLCGFVLLASVTWLLVKRLEQTEPAPVASAVPADGVLGTAHTTSKTI
jgi:hypothetical protein